jgi:hypothetical protein
MPRKRKPFQRKGKEREGKGNIFITIVVELNFRLICLFTVPDANSLSGRAQICDNQTSSASQLPNMNPALFREGLASFKLAACLIHA